MNEYKVYTKTGWWRIDASDDVEAMRKALWFCWRDNEEFVKIVRDNLSSAHIVFGLNTTEVNIPATE